MFLLYIHNYILQYYSFKNLKARYIADSYDDSQGSSYYCPGNTVGFCAVVRIEDGSMPLGGGPVSSADLKVLKAWVADGQKP